MINGNPSEIWRNLIQALNEEKPDWRQAVDKLSVQDKVDRRQSGGSFSNDEVFEALLLALLSSNIDWSIIERVRLKLRDMMFQFSWDVLSSKDDVAIKELYEQFKKESAGSQNLRRMLGYFRDTAKSLKDYAQSPDGVDGYFKQLFKREGSAEGLALALGSVGDAKLRGFGVPLAAEALRNLGYDLAKPDRHVLRAIGMWGLVDFPNWKDRSGNKAPSAGREHLLSTMKAVHKLASASGLSTSKTDTTIWYACARQGGGFSNARLAAMAQAA